MPLYDVRCSHSENIFERRIPLVNFEEPIICSCGAPAFRLISTPMISVDNTSYDCPITGKHIGSKRAHEENLKNHGCRVLEAGETERNAHRIAEEEKALERQIEKTVEREVESYPSAKREKLYNEMISNELEIIRK